SSQIGLGRSTSPDQNAPAAQKPVDLEAETEELPGGRKSRTKLIAIAAIVLVALAGVIFYFTMNPSQSPSYPLRPAAPEGMVYIPNGKFMMGRNDGSSDERPAHEVQVEPFFLDAQEVTNQDYKRFVDATGRPAPKHWRFNGSYVPDEARFPVIYVT